jgi:hypothetical protein
MQNDTIFALHLAFVLCVLSFPFWPVKYARYGIFIPFGISLIWLFFGCCPVTLLHENEGETMTLRLYRMIMPNISQETTDHLNTAIMVGITLLGHYKICNSNNSISYEGGLCGVLEPTTSNNG